ncbi:MAG: HU family DNA-binding protein [Candidatus Sumerlaeota bacterium]|nr:HU family DNA-binding protein [Candidatus Sumerlaeota bacterium]
MTKAEMVEDVAKKCCIKKSEAQEAFETVFDVLSKALKKDKKVLVPGFGSFKVSSRKARKGRNPQTGAEINIPKSKTVRFKPAEKLKEGI